MFKAELLTPKNSGLANHHRSTATENDDDETTYWIYVVLSIGDCCGGCSSFFLVGKCAFWWQKIKQPYHTAVQDKR